MGSLFKYRACGRYADEIFSTGTLHYSTQSSFNDPYDCFLCFNKNKKLVYQVAILTNEKNIIKQNIELSLDKIEKEFCTIIQNTQVLCMSLDGLQMQMWAHYAKNHTGICIEFDDDLLCNSLGDLYSVQYQSDIYQVNYPNHSQENLFGIFCTKELGWKYEQEIRLLRPPKSPSEDGNYSFNKKALKAIYFGTHCSKRNTQKYIKLCLNNGFENVKFYQMELSNIGQFKLLPKEIKVKE